MAYMFIVQVISGADFPILFRGSVVAFWRTNVLRANRKELNSFN